MATVPAQAAEYIGDELYPCQQAGRHLPEAAEYHSLTGCPFAIAAGPDGRYERPYFFVTSRYGVQAEYVPLDSALAGPFDGVAEAIAVRDELWARQNEKGV